MDRKEAFLSLKNRGVLYGDGLFETLRVEGGVPLFLHDHLERMREGIRILRFARAPEKRELKETIAEAIVASGVEEGYLRLTLTRGQGPFGKSLAELQEYTLWAEAKEMSLDPSRYEEGVAAITASLPKNPRSPLCRVKSLNYLESILARQEAVDQGAEEAVFLTVDGDLCEGASANLFLVKEGILITPSLNRGPLPGTVRRWVMELVPRLGLPVEERRVDPAEWHTAEEAFFTNSTWGPFPCVRADQRPIGDGNPGPVTRRLHREWKRAVRAQVERA
ncbi:aminotransferase class IV [Salinithrix halophila]|uniref:Aminotransferase class IV n=1 Tax=Salinithrix halophila TaxID=1485204 RepID=A0ABV8JBQ6_9BACL